METTETELSVPVKGGTQQTSLLTFGDGGLQHPRAPKMPLQEQYDCTIKAALQTKQLL